MNLPGLHYTGPDNAVRKDMHMTDTTAQFVVKGGGKEGPAEQNLASPVFDLHKRLHTTGTVHNRHKFLQKVTFKALILDCFCRLCR